MTRGGGTRRGGEEGIGLIGQSILHFPNKGKAKDNLFNFLSRWGGGRYELKFATRHGRGYLAW